MDNKLTVESLNIEGTFIVLNQKMHDYRGNFSRLFCKTELESILAERVILQINQSITNTKGTIRGMHYQTQPYAEMKLVRCIKGSIWDVMVDLRKDSPTFLKVISNELNSSNACMLIIPEGVAHGFQSLENDSQLIYLHTELFSPNSEQGINPFDPILNINWPLPMTTISERDQSFEMLDKNYKGIEL